MVPPAVNLIMFFSHGSHSRIVLTQLLTFLEMKLTYLYADTYLSLSLSIEMHMILSQKPMFKCLHMLSSLTLVVWDAKVHTT